MKRALYLPGPSWFDQRVKEAAGWWNILKYQAEAIEMAGFEVEVAPPVPEIYQDQPPIAKYFSYCLPYVQRAREVDLIVGAPAYGCLPFLTETKAKKVCYVWNNASWWRRQQLTEEYGFFGRGYPEDLTSEEVNTAALRACDLVIACSPFVKKTHAELVPAEKIVIAPWGVDSEMFAPIGIELYGENPLRVLFVGGDPIRKGLSYLFAALQHVEGVMVEVAGCDVVPPPAIANRVKVLGAVPWQKMPEIMRRNQVICIPTLEDGICFPSGEYLHTPIGIRRIEELREGSVVLSHTGDQRVVNRVMERDYDGDLVAIRGSGMFPLRATPDHPVLSLKRNWWTTGWARGRRQSPNGKHKSRAPITRGQFDASASWRPIKEIAIGDLIALPIPKGRLSRSKRIDLLKYQDEGSDLRFNSRWLWWPTGHGRKVRRFVLPNAKLGELLGWFIAEGSKHSSGVSFALNGKTEMPVAKRIAELSLELFGVPGVVYRQSATVLTVLIESKAVQHFLLKLCGAGAENKRVPEEILYQTSAGPLKALLRAYEKGDGWRQSKAGKTKIRQIMRATTVSRTLAAQLQIAYARAGRCASIQKIPPHRGGFINGREVIGGESYVVSWSAGKDESRHGRSLWLRHDYILSSVSHVGREKFSGKVHNVSVEVDQSYVMVGGAVHNCVAIQEGMASGLVPITSPDAGEVFQHRTDGFVVGFRDIDGIESALTLLRDHPEERRRMAANARRRAEEQTWADFKQVFAEQIKELCQ